MKMRHVGAVLLILGLGGLTAWSGSDAAEPQAAGGADSPWVDVKDVKVEHFGAGRRLTIQLTRSPEYYNDWVIADPPRLILDVGGPLAQYPMPAEQFTLGDDLVRQVRVGSHGPNLRAVLDLTGDVGRRRVRHEGPNIIVDLGDVPAGEATGSIPTVTAAAKVEPHAPAADEVQPIARGGRAAEPPPPVTEPTLARMTVEPTPPTLEPAAEKAPSQVVAAASVVAAPAAIDPTPEPAEAPAAAHRNSGPISVRNVRVETVGSGRRVRIDLNREPSGLRDFTLTGPSRLVIDLDGQPAGSGSAKFPLGDPIVSQVRVAPFEGRLRVVLDLQGDGGPHSVRQEGRSLIADFGQVSSNEHRERTAPALADARSGRSGAGDGFDTHTPPPLRGQDPQPILRAAAPASPVPDAAAGPALVEVEPPTRVAAIAPHAAADDVMPILAVAHVVERGESPAASDPPVELARVDEPTAVVNDAPPPPTPIEREVAAVQAEEPPLPASRRARVRDDAPAVPAAVELPRPRRSRGADLTEHRSYRGQRVSMDFKDADIQNVLRVLADVSGLNLIATDDVKGRVTLHLSDVPWDQALDLVLRSNRLDSTREGNIVRISTVTRFKEERESMRAALDAEKEIEPLKVRYVKVNYARADEALVDKVKGVLTERGSVTFDDRTNTIIVRDIPHGVTDAEELIRELDIQSPQVLIEAHLVEATEDFARGLGVQWGYSYNAGPATGNPTGQNFPGTVGVGGGSGSGGRPSSGLPGVPGVPVPFLADFPVPSSFGSGDAASSLNMLLGSLDGSQALAAKLTALEEAGKGKVISRPRVITLNNVAATIQSLTILRVKLPATGTVINTGAGGVAGGGTSATEKINTGITLVVTPQISSDGFVLMNIYAKSSQPDFSKTVDGIPNEVSREANSNVLVKDNDTVVLGGIYRQNTDDRESGIPYLRSVPGLGWLFKRNLKTTRQEELLVFLTPRIVTTGGGSLPVANRLWEDRRRGG
jgi:type IV pilus secretin PilQ/predicted competence protein